MIYEANYNDYTELLIEQAGKNGFDTGTHLQDMFLYDTDESSLTQRERFIMILVATKYEIEHNILTEELEDELWFYYEDYTEGRLDGILGEDEEEQVIHDLIEFYNRVFKK